jgi:hypothetical protein
MTMKIRGSILGLIVIAAVLIALVLWYGKKQPVEVPPIASVETNAVPPAATAKSPATTSTPVHTNTPIAPVASNVPTPPTESKEQQMREGLAEFNDADIEFYGRLEDQFGNAVGNAQIKFEVPFNNGHAVGVQRGTTVADGNGFFTISGYKGKSLSVVPVKAGYALASLNGGGIYSYLWSESQRVHPDRNNPTVIKMWKLQGAEPLADISKEYKLPFTSAPIFFDLVAGKIVPTGGDLKITVNRPSGEISEHNPQQWSIDVEVASGGFIETSEQEWRIAYFAPEDGYQPSGTFANNNGIGSVSEIFFVKSRDGQVYSKLGLSFDINETPDSLMHVRFRGVANTNASRNWEGDPNTLKMAGQ